MNALLTVFLVAPMAVAAPAATTHYVDCSGGQAGAYTSLAQVNALALAPGDTVLFKRGTRCTGTLAPRGSGAEGSPIRIDAYGTGAKPGIDGAGAPDAVVLDNQQQWEIRNLDVTNTAAGTARRRGVRISAKDAGTLRHLVLEGVDVHDVSGDDSKDVDGSAGITAWVEGGTVPTVFDDLRITGNTVTHADRSGIFLFSDWNRSGWGKRPGPYHPWTEVVVSGNTVTDVGGDGIVLGSVTGAVAEHNRIQGFQRRSAGYSAGLWTHNSDDVLFQFNEVSGGETTRDGMAFDVDQNAFGTVFQYNHSHGNAGGFALLCNADGVIRGAVLRYNLSVDDRYRGVENCSGPIESASVYNNTFVIGDGVSQTVLNENNTTRRNVLFANNIVRKTGAGTASFTLRSGGYAVRNNVINGASAPSGATGTITADPLLAADHRVSAGSPALRAGQTVSGNGGRDYFGGPVPALCAPDIGLHQLSAFDDSTCSRPELLANGGFETGNLSSWASAKAAVVTGQAHTGTYAVRLSGSPATVEQVVALKPATTYTLSGWAKGGEVLLGVKGYGGAQLTAPISGSAYSQASLTFTTGPSTTGATIFCYRHTGTGTAFCDDLSVR
ncbi:right-handed parallel beta-helix repeat-containing protein [Nonomuraea sp. NPDC050556]|uniref:right-handed parallel beta-helix repeat-containing protein n=1 Tax=Nonomuraea sp. NPDC050556 TaxID=3364369 RepID=UPI0037BA9E4C